MPRPLILYSGVWSDLSLEEIAQKASDWGYQGLEICCPTDHLEIQQALGEDGYTQKMIHLLGRYDLQIGALAAHRLGQAVGDNIQPYHQAILPEHVWGDGEPDGVRERATEEMVATIRVAEKLGVRVVSGFSGSTVWPRVLGYPRLTPAELAAGFRDFNRHWAPILDACREAGVQFALEVHPGQIAFDIVTAGMALDAVDGRVEFGFTVDPSHLHCQGLDPIEFLRRYPDRIYHVHIQDVTLNLNGRTSLYAGYLPPGDPNRGYEFRSPGRGSVNWEGLVRVLHEIGYAGALSVEIKDALMQRDHGAQEACKFVAQLDFPPANSPEGALFREASS